MDPRIRSLGKLTIKLALSAAALYIVFQNIDRRQLQIIVASAQPAWLIAAFISFNISKVASSFRLTRYFRFNQIVMSEGANLRLYYIGMFYNLFLPGGIGGDAYKIWFLHKDHSAPVARAFQSVLFDRISGLFLLALLGHVFGWLAFAGAPWRHLLMVTAILVVPALYGIHYFMGKHLLPVFASTTLLSFVVQGFQTLCALALLQSLGIYEETSAYLAVFLLSSAVSVLPISIGGIGIRELVFITAAGFAPISKDASVAFSLMFFFLTAISSLPGGFLVAQKK